MSRVTRASIIAITLIFAVSIGIADVSTGYLPEITIFILVPVMAGTYYIGFRFGLSVAIIAAASELVAHLALEAGAKHTEVIYSTVAHTFIYILTAALITRLVRQLEIISNLEEQRSWDLDIARSVHESVFTPIPGSFGTLSIGSRVAFARELGGDYYYVNGLGEDLFLCIADISGKSMAAALFAALLDQSVTEALEHTRDLKELVSRVNSNIDTAFPEDMFVTMFCALISGDALTYINAGAPPPLLYSRQAGSMKTLLSSQALPVGIERGLEIATTTEPFGPGDVFVVMTDGITESLAFREKPYEKLEELLDGSMDAEAQEITNAIFSRAVPKSDENPLDDIIVVCVKRRP